MVSNELDFYHVLAMCICIIISGVVGYTDISNKALIIYIMSIGVATILGSLIGINIFAHIVSRANKKNSRQDYNN